MLGEFACETFGRKDLKYQNWRWLPCQCDLPRYVSLIQFAEYWWDIFKLMLKQVQWDGVS